MERIELGKSNKFLLVHLLGSLGFVAGGIFILLAGGPTLVGWMAIVFFGACALVLGKQMLSAGARLVIDHGGVLDRTLGVGIIPWDRIENAFVKQISSSSFVCLEITRVEDFLRGLSPLKRKLVDLNVKLGYSPLSLNLTGLDADPREVCELILKQIESRRLRTRSS